jgi:hypothetical protein
MRKVLAVPLAILWMLPAHAQVQTTISPTLPSLGAVDKDPNDPDAIYCRPPQPQTGSRLAGPKTCRPNRVWNDLHAQGLDIGPDGESVVASEKYRALHGE